MAQNVNQFTGKPRITASAGSMPVVRVDRPGALREKPTVEEVLTRRLQETVPEPELDLSQPQDFYKQLPSASRQAASDLISGFFADPTMPQEEFNQLSGPEAFGVLLGAAPFGLPKTGVTGLPGIWSRVEQTLSKLPGKVHINKLRSALQSGSSADERAWRGVDDVVEQAFKNAGPTGKIDPQQILEEVAKRPIELSTKKLGGPIDEEAFRGWFQENYPESQTFAEKNPDWLSSLKKQWQSDLGLEPKWTPYQMPGPKTNEQNDLILLGKEGDPELYHDRHWDTPNILAHVRHNTRRLPGELPDGYRMMEGTNEQFNPAVWVEGPGYSGSSVRTIHRDAAQIAQNKAMQEDLGLEGRMLENVQSAWHQAGGQRGYDAAVTPVNVEAKAAAARGIDEAHKAAEAKFHDIVRQVDEQGLTGPGLRTITSSFMDAPEDYIELRFWLRDRASYLSSANPEASAQLLQLQQELTEATTAVDNAYDAFDRFKPGAIPDAPFKDTWTELALKQQLLDIAQNAPETKWLGIAPSTELHSRGEMISPEFQDKQLPNSLERIMRGAFGSPVPARDAQWLRMRPEEIYSKDVTLNPVSMAGYSEEEMPLRWAEVQRVVNGGSDRDELTSVASTWPRVPKTEANKYGLDPDAAAEDLIEQLILTRPDLTAPQPVKAPVLRLSPEILEEILRKGFPAMALGGLGVGQALQSPTMTQETR